MQGRSEKTTIAIFYPEPETKEKEVH